MEVSATHTSIMHCSQAGCHALLMAIIILCMHSPPPLLHRDAGSVVQNEVSQCCTRVCSIAIIKFLATCCHQ